MKYKLGDSYNRTEKQYYLYLKNIEENNSIKKTF